MTNRTHLLTLGFAATAATASTAHAGGILVGESGSQPQARAGAFVAKADDPTALSVNPAGLAKLGKRAAGYIGINVVDYSITVQREGAYQPPEMGTNPSYTGEPFPEVSNQTSPLPIPYLAATMPIGPVVAAIGFFAPQAHPNRDFGCGADADCAVGPAGGPNPVRYDVLSQEVLLGLPSVAAAYSLNERFDVGLRLSWGFGTLKARSYTWGVTNDEEDIEKEGDFRVDVADKFIPAFGAGLTFRPTSSLEIGVAYSSELTLAMKGTGQAILGEKLDALMTGENFLLPVDDDRARCAPGGTINSLKACVTVVIPQNATVGARWAFRDAAGNERGDIELDVRWEQWSAASDATVIVDARSTLGPELKTVKVRHGFEDTLSVRLGGSARLGSMIEARAGVSYDTAAAPTSWTRADEDGMEQLLFSGGIAVDFGARWRVDAGAAYVVQGARDVRQVTIEPPGAVPQRQQPDAITPLNDASVQPYHPINNGHYESGYVIGMIGVTAGF